MRFFIVSILVCFLLACGNAPAGFVDQTPHSPAYLNGLWADAQVKVAKGGLPMNIWQKGSSTIYSAPAGNRALAAQPRGLIVASLPSQVPNAEALICPDCGPWVTTPVEAYSIAGSGVYYCDFYDGRPATLENILTYEFESQIMYQLGYDITWR